MLHEFGPNRLYNINDKKKFDICVVLRDSFLQWLMAKIVDILHEIHLEIGHGRKHRVLEEITHIKI